MGTHCCIFCVVISCVVNVIVYVNIFLLFAFFIEIQRDIYLDVTIIQACALFYVTLLKFLEVGEISL
jgi:hypothetical protein